MSYLSYHHGSYWFQLRVPALLVAKYGRVLRVHLRTQERSVAQHPAYQMAGQWLERFQAGRLDPGHLNHPPRQNSCRLFMMLNPGRQGREMARYGEAFRNRVVARFLPPESAEVSEVSREIGVSVPTLERWREDAQSMPARGRAWTARARLEAVITTAAMDETGKSAWCREHGVYPAELDQWFASSKTCHCCGYKMPEMPLHIRIWRCPECGRHAGISYHRVPDADGDTGDDCRIYTGGICGIERRRILLLPVCGGTDSAAELMAGCGSFLAAYRRLVTAGTAFTSVTGC